MIRLLKYLRKQEWLLFLLSVLFIVAQVGLELTMPDYMREITRLIQTEGSQMSEILQAGGMMLLCALGSLLASVITSICAARIGSGYAATLRENIFRKVQSFSMAEIGRFSTASLITRSTNDVNQVLMLIVMGMQMLIRAPIMAVWAITKISTKQAEWTLSTAAAIGALVVVVLVALLVALPKFRQLQKLTDNLNRVTRENVNGLSVVRAYNAEGYQEQKFDQANEELTRTQLFAQHTMSFLMPSIQIIMNGLSLAIYWIGALLINQAGLGAKIALFSDMMVFSQYALQIIMAFMMLVAIFILMPRATVAAGRIGEVLGTELSIQDGTRQEGLPGQAGCVEFRHVNFHYPDAGDDVIRDISFTVRKGETLAIIGATGCGKSTVVNLIPRFYDASAGQVLVDGVDVREWNQEALRNRIGYISQKATLFSGTIDSNVAYGENGREKVTEEDIRKALDIAQAGDFVDHLGLDGKVAQGGGNLSGGQKQRISIARAIARDPEILIFDDSFSALDYRTDRILRQALKEQCGNTTRIIVAQRIGAIRDADTILVMQDGETVGIGTHETLMRDCEAYQQIALSQLSKEELA